jgi:hypothetical protein
LEVSEVFFTFAPNIKGLRMRKYILIITILAFTAGLATASSMPEIQGVAEQIDKISMTIEGKTVVVNNAQGETLIVVSLTGRQVAQYSIDSPSQRIELNLSKGCYVLKVGNIVRKVSIR